MTSDIPHPDYLVVGGGMAADAAVKAILERDAGADILMLSEEESLPYARPPLTKDLWTSPNTTPADIMLDPEPYGGDGVKVRLSTRVDKIDRAAKRVIDHHGREYGYSKLLLATGGSPRKLPGDQQGVIYFRTLQHYRELQEKVALNQRIAVIGSGFLGNEIAASLSMRKCGVVQILPGNGVGSGIYPQGLSQHLSEIYRGHGIELIPGQRAHHLERSGDHVVVCARERGKYAADSVVAALGITPNVHLAEACGLEVDDGVKVNARLQTRDPDIYAAGDVATVYRAALGRHARVEHEDNALGMGKAAGTSMAGGDVSYDDTPMFYSDLFDDGFEAVGNVNASLDMYEDWSEPHKKGVVYYLRNGSVEGVLMWNVWGQTDKARDLIADDRPVTPAELKGKIR